MTIYDKKMIITKNMLLQPRVAKLKLKEVCEKRLNGQRKENTYVYEFVLGMISTSNVSGLNIMDESESDKSTITTMFSRSILRFTGSEILGLIPKSLEVTRGGMTSRREATDSKQFPDVMEVSTDLISNSVDFRYFIIEPSGELEMKINVMMNNRLSMASIGSENFELDTVKLGFRETETLVVRDTCTWLQIGYNWHLISNQREISKCIQPGTDHGNPDNMRGLPSLMWPGMFLQLSRKRAANGERKSESGSNLKKSIILILEILNHQRLIMITNSDRGVDFIKQLIMATLQKWNYYPRGTESVDTRCRPFDIGDIRIMRDMHVLHEGQTLGEQLGSCQIARCAILTSRPRISDGITLRTGPESQRQKDILFKFQSSYVLLRNLKACNRAAETLMDAKERMRFSTPETETKGWIYCRDFGELIMCVAQEVRKLSMNLLMLSDMMKKSENFTRGTTEYENYKHTIQNVMHAARYAGPLFRAISRFTIPLQSESPRRIGILG